MQYLVFCLLHITMLFTPGRAGVKQCNSTVSSLYVRKGQEKRLQPTEGLLAALASKQSDEYMLRRWDGVLGTFDTHLDWMYQHARRFTDPGTPGFRGYGTHSGIQYEINDELTKIGGGDGYFRLSGEIDIPPEGLIAQVMDSDALGELDPTVMYLNFLHRYSADPRSRMCLWIAAPGFPFQWRMVSSCFMFMLQLTQRHVIGS